MVDKGISLQYLSDAYLLSGQRDSAFKYAQRSQLAKDSIYKARMNSLAEFQSLTLKEQLRLRDIEKERALFESSVRTYALIAALVVFSLIAMILYRNNRQKQKANKALESTLTELRSTQAQLIQSEKMASLGELTAGIAHEIQNPLNFVNNFSQLNAELASEQLEALQQGNIREAEELSSAILENEQKIIHHGKRAEGIVKGMLQHSRSSSGINEPTDINALCEEYLRLALHGYQAKNNGFDAIAETVLDPTIPKITAMKQDMGRALVNLINNAFYAVHEKQKNESLKPGSGYQPKVVVSTRNLGSRIEIRVEDNGPGVNADIKDKIFQPFYTTKPTGQGTGLGLSLSYDIVKAHGGTLSVETGESGAAFLVVLPV
jgi:signal transduction histidine kinase